MGMARKETMSKLITLSLMSFAIAACAVEQEQEPQPPVYGETAEIPIPDELILDTPAEQGDAVPLFSGRKCIDQSSASGNRVSCELIPFCTNNWDATLSRNHPFRFNQACGGDYVKVQSLWTGLCYIVRKGALRDC